MTHTSTTNTNEACSHAHYFYSIMIVKFLCVPTMDKLRKVHEFKY